MFLLFDVGATKMRVAVSDGQHVDFPHSIPTPSDPGKGIALMHQIGRSLVPEGGRIEGVAACVSGVFNTERTALVSSPNLPDWVGAPLKTKLEDAFSAPVFLENDATCAALGEAVYGAGMGKRIVAFLTVSTGVGGARIVDGRIDARAVGFEPGHQIIDSWGSRKSACGVCGQGGCLEGFISGAALKTRYGKESGEIVDEAVWKEVAEALAVGLCNSIVHWSPDIIVLGGAVMRNKIPLDQVVSSLKERMKIFQSLPEVRMAALQDASGLWGALALVQKK